jgi:hypothetical protein
VSRRTRETKTDLPLPPTVYAKTGQLAPVVPSDGLPASSHGPKGRVTRQIISGFPVAHASWAKRLGADIAERAGTDPQLSGVLRSIIAGVISSDLDWSTISSEEEIRELVASRLRGEPSGRGDPP